MIITPIPEVWLEAIKVEGRRRDHAHKGHRSYLADHDRKDEHNITGLVGEVGFSFSFAIPVDWSDRLAGDKGTDFILGRSTIDVKTAQMPKYLFLPVSAKNHSDIYVLAGWYLARMEVHLIGWAYANELLAAPRLTTKYNVENHHIGASELRPVEDLLTLARRYRKGLLA
jgi:hypothetical protein